MVLLFLGNVTLVSVFPPTFHLHVGSFFSSLIYQSNFLVIIFCCFTGVYSANKDVEEHLAMGKKLLAAGQLAEALSHYHAAVGKIY